ncbi:MAG: PepSY-like domain-containing protein [Bacteroidota bacterium]
MKKLVVFSLTFMISLFSFAQKIKENELPEDVKTAFKNIYPQTKAEKWEKEGNNFEAEFKHNKIEQSVLFDAQGNILETEIEIEKNKLPNTVLEYVKTNYKGHSIKEAAKINDSKDAVFFEVEIKGMDVIFDSNGKFLREVKD